MTTILEKIETWPRSMDRRPVLKSTEDATVYATLIYDQPAYVTEITNLRIKNLHEIGEARRAEPVSFVKLSAYAITGQMYRQCIDEITRLKAKSFPLNQGGH